MKVYIVIVLFFAHISDSVCQEIERKVIVSELERLRDAVISNNVEGLSNFFIFPITEKNILNAMKLCSEDQEISNEIDTVNKELFIIRAECIMNFGLTDLFKNVKIKSLLTRNKTEKKIYSKEFRNWFYQYKIEIENDNIVILCIDYNHDTHDYDDENVGEHNLWFYFEFKNNKMVFSRLLLAG